MGYGGRSLALTPSWIIALVCTVIVAVSFAVERGIHRLAMWLKRSKQKAWYEALEKMKEELMLLGFISISLVVTQYYIVEICLPEKVLQRWTPCDMSHPGSGTSCAKGTYVEKTKDSLRRLLEYSDGFSEISHGRMLADDPSKDPCQGTCRAGYQPVISIDGLHQLHIFIFVLACVHVFYSALTMVLSMLKIHSWKKWETEAQGESHDSLAEITKALTLNRQSTFIRYHTSNPWSRNRLIVWIVCFFRQFHTSVTRADYLALRLGFLTNHNLDKSFNFYTYMVRSMEDEFKEIVGISAYLWAYVIGFLLFNVSGVNFYFWISLVPPIMLLLIGCKLQHVIATLALENAKIQGPFNSRRLKPRDELFWFNSPNFLLGIIHFVLFQNAFELATFFWFWWQFSLQSCFLEQKAYNIIRLVLGFIVQIICSYSTLPLYALVSQMGSNYKIGGQVKGALHGWRKRAKKKLGSIAELDFSRGSTPEHQGSSHAHSQHGGSVHAYPQDPKVFSSSYSPSPHGGSTPLHHLGRHGASDSSYYGGQFAEDGTHLSMIRLSPAEVSQDVEQQVRDDSGLKRSSATKLT